MNLGIIGSGYLGTVLSACLADLGVPVTCCDPDTTRVFELANGTLRFHEKNLKEIIRRNVRAQRLVYCTDLESVVCRTRTVFLAEDSCENLEDMVQDVAHMASRDTILVIATPTPVGTVRRVVNRLRDAGRKNPVVCQPFALTDGCAVEDFNWPDRMVLGAESPEPIKILKEIYRPLVMRGIPVIVTSYETAELVREASTAFVATKMSFINEMTTLCEHIGADAADLALAMGLDKKIGPRCLQPGVRIGGPFAESEIKSLAGLATAHGVSLKVLDAAREVGSTFSDRIMEKLASIMSTFPGTEVGILGLSFKPNTNSVAGSVPVSLARRLVSEGAHVRAYDPVAIPEAQRELDGAVFFCEDAYQAAEGSDALVVGTGWPEFRALDWHRVKKLLKKPVIFDTKNLLDASHLREMGFRYVGMGRV